MENLLSKNMVVGEDDEDDDSSDEEEAQPFRSTNTGSAGKSDPLDFLSFLGSSSLSSSQTCSVAVEGEEDEDDDDDEEEERDLPNTEVEITSLSSAEKNENDPISSIQKVDSEALLMSSLNSLAANRSNKRSTTADGADRKMSAKTSVEKTDEREKEPKEMSTMDSNKKEEDTDANKKDAYQPHVFDSAEEKSDTTRGDAKHANNNNGETTSSAPDFSNLFASSSLSSPFAPPSASYSASPSSSSSSSSYVKTAPLSESERRLRKLNLQFRAVLTEKTVSSFRNTANGVRHCDAQMGKSNGTIDLVQDASDRTKDAIDHLEALLDQLQLFESFPMGNFVANEGGSAVGGH